MIYMLNGLEKGKKLNPKYAIWEVLMVTASNIVVVHRCIFFLYFRLSLILLLIEYRYPITWERYRGCNKFLR